MGDFLPRYQEFLQAWTRSLSLHPKVVSIEEIKENGAVISPQTKQLTVHFNKPTDSSKGMSIYIENQEIQHFPPLDMPGCRYSPEGRKLIIKFKEELKPDWDYSFIMKGQNFRSKDGYPLRDKAVFFKTATK